jgi:F-type H+-transporting ATPase subunit alpha
MLVAEQVAILFAGTQGFLDDVPLEKVKDFEKALLTFLREKHYDLLKTLSQEVTKEAEETLKRLLASFKSEWRAA